MSSDTCELAPDEFPALLAEIADPPKQLFLRGVLPPSEYKLLAVVGSREYTNYGREVCETLISGLAGYPVSIISGLALGIDGIAHKAALRAGLHTIAVPGSGLDERVLYPAAHRALAREILEAGGALLSEFAPDWKPRPESFPQRNRIMAGMCHATLIIEATEKSGTLITARLAMEYNRDVLAVPGSIFGATSFGPHMLIRNGATPVTKSADILEALHIQAETDPARTRSIRSVASLSPNEQRVHALISVQPRSRDELVSALDMEISEANVLLSAMELKGLITESLGEIHPA